LVRKGVREGPSSPSNTGVEEVVEAEAGVEEGVLAPLDSGNWSALSAPPLMATTAQRRICCMPEGKREGRGREERQGERKEG